MRLALFTFSILFFAACQEPVTVQKKVVIDPNNTSEMALQMRDMYEQLADIKLKIEVGDSLSSEQLAFALIHELEATDESFRKQGLEAMSIAYASAVDQFNKNPDKKAYQTLINNCVSCHQSLCPGPLERIDNLIIE